MKKVIDIFKRLAFGVFILLIFNKMAVSFDVFIPINIITVLIVGLFNIFGLLLLVILNFILL